MAKNILSFILSNLTLRSFKSYRLTRLRMESKLHAFAGMNSIYSTGRASL